MLSKRPIARILRSKLTPFAQQTRSLNLHQHQSQKLLEGAGVTIPRGRVAKTPAEAHSAVEEFGNGSIINAQVLDLRRKERESLATDARGSNVSASDPGQAQSIVDSILNSRGAFVDDVQVREVYVSEKPQFDEVWYVGMTVDRENYCPTIILSKQGGGKGIRAIAKDFPESVQSFNFGLTAGITDSLVSEIQNKASLTSEQAAGLKTVLEGMHAIFKAKDALLLEVRSLGVTSSGAMTAIDSNFMFDDDASKRQPDLFALRDTEQEVRDEVAAEDFGLVYIRTDGNIGNVVNGAGLAMATNDAVSLYGGKSANFLDAGGQATTETMIQAFKIILRDPRVTTIFVNIYGGITRCDMIAESIIGAAAAMDIHVPMVVRLQGTNSAAGLKLVDEANLGLYVEEDFGKAAEMAVNLANRSQYDSLDREKQSEHA